MSDLFRGLGVEIKFKEESDFLKIKETLTRIGVASNQAKVLWQSVHILHKQGNYALLHFKELFALDGKQTDFSEEDKGRRNTIAALLQEWNLLTVLDPSKIEAPRASLSNIKIIPFADKKDWSLQQKYQIGRFKKKV